MKKVMIFFFFLLSTLVLLAEEPIVSIYDEFDEGLFGKSIYRGIIISLKRAVFNRSETLIIKNGINEGFLTAVVIKHETVQKLISGYYNLPLKRISGRDIYFYDKDNLKFSFSVEKPNIRIINVVSEFYKNDNIWHDQLISHYKENYVIRVFSAENVFESWTEEITYNEALIIATLIGDNEQWLWGIHDGRDILNSDF